MKIPNPDDTWWPDLVAAVAAKKLGRHFLGFEISPGYCAIAEKRIALVEMQPTPFEKKAEQMTLNQEEGT